jgi:mRNA interferase MazF
MYRVRLDPTHGSEIRKTRPCLIVSPNELNRHLRTIVIAPMTTRSHAFPWRVPCRFKGRAGFVAVDQLRTVDAERLTRRLGHIAPDTLSAVLGTLQEMFAE